jgi:hypothetical protein
VNESFFRKNALPKLRKIKRKRAKLLSFVRLADAATRTEFAATTETLRLGESDFIAAQRRAGFSPK